MSLVVTGAAGQLGGLVVEALLARGVEPATIVAASRDTGRLARFAERGVTVRTADFADPGSLPAAFAGAERVLVVSTDAVGRRHELHGNAVRAAAGAGTGLIAYTSIPYADTATSLLAAEHRDTEEMIRATGVPFAFLRNSWYQENYTGQLATVLAHGLVGAAGAGEVSAAARADYAEAAAAVLTADDEAGVHELGGPALTLPQIAALIAAESGQEVAYHDLPPAQLRDVYAGAGMPAAMVDVLVDADRALAEGELRVDPAELERLIGRPTTPFADTVRAALA